MKAFTFDPRQIANLDKVIHEPARLSVMACLAVVETVDFVFIQSQTGLTGGNLSSHIRKLDDAGYIKIEKAFVDGKPRTSVRMTIDGRQAFEEYIRTARQFLGQITKL